MMMHQPKFVLLVLAAILNGANCDSSDGSEGIWARLKGIAREFVDSMKKFWTDMKKEIKSRTSDMSSLTKEAFESFKDKMNDWINNVGGTSEKEKEDMRKYIERLEMPNVSGNHHHPINQASLRSNHQTSKVLKDAPTQVPCPTSPGCHLEFVDSMKKIWNDMKGEIKSSGMGSWTKELFDSFRNTMNDWINGVGGASKK